MKAKTQQQEVTVALTQTLQPYVGESKPAKAIASTLDKLAKQLVKHQHEQEKTNARAAVKASRQALAEELMGTLAPYLGETVQGDSKAAKSLAKTVAKLAEQLTKHQRKQQKQARQAAALTEGGPKATKPARPAAKSTPARSRPVSPAVAKSKFAARSAAAPAPETTGS